MIAGRRPGRRQAGQASVELALCLPVLVMALLLVVQVGLVVADQVRVVQAAREGARVAAVDPDHAAIRAGARIAAGLDPSRTRVVIGPRGAPGALVSVTVRYRAPTDLPLVGALVPDPALSATATMRVER